MSLRAQYGRPAARPPASSPTRPESGSPAEMGAAAAEADRTLFVGNLETKVTEELLFELFHQVRHGHGPRAAGAVRGPSQERSAPGRNPGAFGPKVTSDNVGVGVFVPVKVPQHCFPFPVYLAFSLRLLGFASSHTFPLLCSLNLHMKLQTLKCF